MYVEDASLIFSLCTLDAGVWFTLGYALGQFVLI